MISTQQLSLALPKEMAFHVREKVASGEDSDESEVTREGLRAYRRVTGRLTIG